MIPASRRPLMWFLLLLPLAGCARPGPPVPLTALNQRPPAVAIGQAWTATGRCLIDAPGTRLSGRAVVRRLPGEVRLALLADEGPVAIELAAGTAVADGLRIERCRDGLRPAAQWLGALAWQVWGEPAGTPARDGDRWRADDGKAVRWYGGDPLLLRAVALPDVGAQVGDYRLDDVPGRPHALLAEGMLFTLGITLDGFTAPAPAPAEGGCAPAAQPAP